MGAWIFQAKELVDHLAQSIQNGWTAPKDEQCLLSETGKWDIDYSTVSKLANDSDSLQYERGQMMKLLEVLNIHPPAAADCKSREGERGH